MSRVAVVVPTVDRVDLLARTLRGLAAQTRPADEVLVVHDGDAGVQALLAEHDVPGLRIAARGVSAKRNAGWRATTAELVAFTDDDCEPDPGWLAALAAADGDVLCGPVDKHPDDAGVSSVFARQLVVERELPAPPGANLALRRAALVRTTGFDESLSGGEDVDLVWRAVEDGARRTWVGDALVHHAVRPMSFPAHLRSLDRWVTLPEVVKRHPVLRDTMIRRVFWRDQHPLGALALLGLVLTPVRPAALALTLPLAVRRVRERGPRFGAQTAVADVAEVAVCAVGSVRARSLML